MKGNILKIAGVVAVAGGAVALYLSGVQESEVGGLVAGVFVLVGIIAALFKKEEQK